MKNKTYKISIRCQYGESSENYTQHRQRLTLGDIPKWLEAYHFTHPNVYAFSIKIWLNDKEDEKEDEEE